jgi:hypothetical protein
VYSASIKNYGIKKRNYTQKELTKFNVDVMYAVEDGRTSLMVKNIPNKYT